MRKAYQIQGRLQLGGKQDRHPVCLKTVCRNEKGEFPDAGKEKTPPLPWATINPLNMFYNMWNLRNGFRLPVKACRPPLQLIPGFVSLRFKDCCLSQTGQGNFSLLK
jgi:hypothetical protein